MVDVAKIGGMDFIVDAIPAKLPDLAGIYALLRVDDGNCKVLYVGETDDLGRDLTKQFQKHALYDSAILQAKANYLATKVLTVGKRARLDIVARLNDQYEPVFRS